MPQTLEPLPPAPHAADPSGDGHASADSLPPVDGEALRRASLTDFLTPEALQEIQDSFASITRLKTTIRDADGHPLTDDTDTAERARSEEALEQLLSPELDAGETVRAPILLEGRELGSIGVEADAGSGDPVARERLAEAARALGVPGAMVGDVVDAAEAAYASRRSASVQFLYLMAASIARLCAEQHAAGQRVEELSALYRVSTVLSAHRDLKQVLDVACRNVAEVMRVRSASIRLLERDADGDGELVPRATHNLSQEYLDKGAVRLGDSPIFRDALAGEAVWVPDMASDDRVVYPGDAAREGLASMLLVGLTYQNRPIGTMQLFTASPRSFSEFEVSLVRAIAQLTATAIENARLDAERSANRDMVRQLHLAADVQRRMLPRVNPTPPGFDIAGRYVPSFDLGGDFYDFIDLDGHVGVAVGDVVGKGVAASLLMASVRASLRAYAQDVYDLDEIISRVNNALCRDTLDNEFATLWYGVLDPSRMRLTYCNAGHEPPLLCRDGNVYTLDTGGMIVGVDPTQAYQKGLWDLKPGDCVLLYTDGLPDARNEAGQRFGRPRVEALLREIADRSASDGLNHILWHIRRFSAMRRAVDDTTLVVVRVERK